MKYVLIAEDTVERRYMYGGIDNIDDGCALFLKHNYFINRKTRKFIYGYTINGKYKQISNLLTKRTIRKQIINRLKYIGKNEQIVFILLSRVYETLGEDLISSLKSYFPNSKYCAYFTDLQKNFSVDLEIYRRDFDILFTFDKAEAEQYGMKYALEPFTYHNVENKDPNYDITFVGSVKKDGDRLEELLDAYEKFKAHGLKCDFRIINVPEEKQRYKGEIVYNQYLQFDELIEHVLNSRCVLEIVQDNGYSPTTRYTEACLFGRNLITNCRSIIDGTYPNDGNIFTIEYLSDINYEWIKEDHPVDTKKFKAMFSMRSFVDTIDQQLNKAE